MVALGGTETKGCGSKEKSAVNSGGGPQGRLDGGGVICLLPGAEEEFSSRREGTVFPEEQQVGRPDYQPIHIFSEGETQQHLTGPHRKRITPGDSVVETQMPW